LYDKQAQPPPRRANPTRKSFPRRQLPSRSTNRSMEERYCSINKVKAKQGGKVIRGLFSPKALSVKASLVVKI